MAYMMLTYLCFEGGRTGLGYSHVKQRVIEISKWKAYTKLIIIIIIIEIKTQHLKVALHIINGVYKFNSAVERSYFVFFNCGVGGVYCAYLAKFAKACVYVLLFLLLFIIFLL